MTSTASIRTTILAAIEPSSAGAEVIRTASAMARIVAGGELHLVHVIDPGVMPASIAGFMTEVIADGRAYLDSARATAEHLASCPVTGHLAFGHPAARIVELASEMASDLVIVGTHGKRGLARILGSVSQQVVIKAPCQVLVARVKDESAHPAIEQPCADCVAVQFESRGETSWCARHAEHHVHAHLHYGTTANFGGGSMLIRPRE